MVKIEADYHTTLIQAVQAFRKRMQPLGITSDVSSSPYRLLIEAPKDFWVFYQELYPKSRIQTESEQVRWASPIHGPTFRYHLNVDGRHYGARTTLPHPIYAKRATLLSAAIELIREEGIGAKGAELLVMFKQYLDKKYGDGLTRRQRSDYDSVDGKGADSTGSSMWSMLDLN